jgi:hypothetical protein
MGDREKGRVLEGDISEEEDKRRGKLEGKIFDGVKKSRGGKK